MRSIRRVIVFIMLMAAGAVGTAHAQAPGTIAGTVFDAPSGEPLPEVNVVVVGAIFGDATDASGRFQIEGVPPGSYTVQVSTLGYRTARRTITVEAGATATVEFRLTPSEAATGAAAAVADPAELQPIVRIEEQRLRELNGPDAGVALRTMPGVEAARRGPLGFDPNVRGFTEAQVGVYLDGIHLVAGSPLRMHTPLSPVDPTALRRIEVVKGPYALTQGAGAMSTIRMETPPVEPGAAAGGYLQGSFQGTSPAAATSGALRGSLFGIGYGVHGAYRTGNDYTAGNGASVPADYESGAVRGTLVYPLTPVSKLTVIGGYQNQRDIDDPRRLLHTERSETGQGSVRYRMQRERGTLRGLDVQAYATQTLHRMTNDGKPAAARDTFSDGSSRPPVHVTADSEVQTFGGRAGATIAPASNWRLEVGGDVVHTYRDAIRERIPEGPIFLIVIPPDQVWPAVTITEAGLFARAARPWGPVDVAATVRADLVWADADRASAAFLDNAGGLTEADLRATETNWSGALNLGLPLSKQWTLTLGGGSVVRTAGALERYADRFLATRVPSAAETQGNPRLDPERSMQVDLGLEGVFERGRLHVSAFARRISDYITLEPTTIEPRLPTSPGIVYRYVNGEATFYGGEVQGRYKVNPLLTLRGHGSYLWGRDASLDEPALGIVPLSGEVTARVDVPFSESLFLESTLHWSAKQDRVASARGETSTDGYTIADVRLGVAPAPRTTLTLSLENITDTAYAHPLNARIPASGAPVPEPGRTLAVQLRVTF